MNENIKWRLNEIVNETLQEMEEGNYEDFSQFEHLEGCLCAHYIMDEFDIEEWGNELHNELLNYVKEIINERFKKG